MSVDAQRLQDNDDVHGDDIDGAVPDRRVPAFLWQLLALGMLAGVGVMLVTIPVVGRTAMLSRRYQRRVMACKDERVKLTSEALGGVRVIKLYAWERPLAAQIAALRDAELRALWRYKLTLVLANSVFMAVPTLVSLVAFATYALVYGASGLATAQVFTAIAFFGVLRFPLMMVPRAVADDRRGAALARRVERASTARTRGCSRRSRAPTTPTAAAATAPAPRRSGRPRRPRAPPPPRAPRAPRARASATAARARCSPTDDDDDDALVLAAAAAPRGPGVRVAGATLAWANGAALLRDVSFDVAPGELVVRRRDGRRQVGPARRAARRAAAADGGARARRRRRRAAARPSSRSAGASRTARGRVDPEREPARQRALRRAVRRRALRRDARRAARCGPTSRSCPRATRPRSARRAST